jgi:hypothetical protein
MSTFRPAWSKVASVLGSRAQRHASAERGGMPALACAKKFRALPPVVLAGALTVLSGSGSLLGTSLLGTAHATVVEALDLDTLVQDADEVVLARVIKQWSHYDERGRIVTDFQMQVEQSVKGDSMPGAAVVVRKLGGVVGDRGMRISGEPSFTEGEVVLVFGTRGKKTYLRPVGMGQGTMRVYEQDGQRWARSDAQGMMLTKRGDTTTKSRAALAEPRKLYELLDDVRTIVALQK